MRRYRSLILIVLLGISMIGFSRNNDRNNNNSRPGGNQNQNNGNNRPGNNSRPGNNNTNDRNPGWNNNSTGNSGKYCAEKKRNSNQCIRYENYNGGQLPNKPPKL